MKKIIVICLVIMIFILAGCQNNSNEIKFTTDEIIPIKTVSTIDEIIPTETTKTDVESLTIITTETQVENNEVEFIQKEETIENLISYSNSWIYSPEEFQKSGIIEWNGWSWTYYTSQILPGKDLYLPGRFTDENGYICDGDGYICIASTALPWGTIVDTPFGRQGKVYDSGCDSYILDVYTNW